MGIDIYAVWKGQTVAEKNAQITGFSVVSGRLGYLREAYHGEPYVTKYLCREAFESPNGWAQIAAEALRERLPEAIRLAKERQREIYGVAKPEDINPILDSYRDFVGLCEEKEEEMGEPVAIVANY